MIGKNDLFRIVEIGEKVLKVDEITKSTFHMRNKDEIRKSLVDIKEQLIKSMLKEYEEVQKNQTSVNDHDSVTNEMISNIKKSLESAPKTETETELTDDNDELEDPDENKTLEELSEEPKPKPKPKPKTRIKTAPSTKKSAYSKR